MRVLFVYPRYHTNSVGWVYALNKNNVQVSMLTIYKGATEDYSQVTPELIKPSMATQFRLRLAAPNHNNWNTLRKIFIPSFPFVIRYLLKAQPDFVICRDRNLTSLVMCIACRILKIRRIIYDQRPWNQKEGLIKTIITSLFFSRYHMSPLTKNKPELLNNNTYYIPFSVNNNFHPKKYMKSNKVNFLTIGKYEPRKNILLILEAVKILCSNYDITLNVIGEVSTQEHETYYNLVSQKIESEHLENVVTIQKNVPYGIMNSFWQESDIFILASVNECASVSQLEAMANGLAVIIGSDNGTAEYVVDNLSGKIVDIHCPCTMNNNQELLSAMEFYCLNPDEIYMQGNYAKEIVNKTYSSDAVFSSFKNMFNELSVLP